MAPKFPAIVDIVQQINIVKKQQTFSTLIIAY